MKRPPSRPLRPPPGLKVLPWGFHPSAQFVVEETRLLLCCTWLHVLFLGSKSSSLIFFFFLLRSLRHLFVNLILLHTLILMLCEQKQKTQNTIFNEKHYVSTDHEWHQAFTRALYCFVEGWNSIFNIFFVHSSCLKIYGRLVIFIINRFLRGPAHGFAKGGFVMLHMLLFKDVVQVLSLFKVNSHVAVLLINRMNCRVNCVSFR